LLALLRGVALAVEAVPGWASDQ